MRVVIVTVLLLASAACAYADQPQPMIDVQHDSVRGVTCWILHDQAISCLPDSQLLNRGITEADQREYGEAPAGEQFQRGPTPASTPTPRSHREVFQL